LANAGLMYLNPAPSYNLPVDSATSTRPALVRPSDLDESIYCLFSQD
jgi:hypothetical protein